jgi:hypothetical protein
MEWLKELLKAQGLTDAQITAIVGGVETNYKGYVPEHRFKEVNDAKKAAEDGLKDRDKQLEEIKKSAGDSKVLQDQITQLQADNKTASDKYEAEVKELRLGTAVKLALTGKVHDPDIVASLLDKTKIELDDAGNVKGGLDDQVKALQTSKAFLFVPEGDSKPRFKGAKPPEGGAGGGGNEDTSVGASFAKAANESGKAPAAALNPWG